MSPSTAIGSALLPGEYRLFHLINPRVVRCSAFNANPTELNQNCAGWSMNEVAPERDLNNGAITLWNVDIARRIIATKRVQPDSVHRSDLVR